MRALTRWAVPLLVIGGVFALAPVFGQKAREDVRAEAASAARAGQIAHGEVTREPATGSVRDRADVKAESRAAVKAGAIDRGEVRSTPPDAASTPAKSRAEVRAEAASALGMKKPEIPAEATRK